MVAPSTETIAISDGGDGMLTALEGTRGLIVLSGLIMEITKWIETTGLAVEMALSLCRTCRQRCPDYHSNNMKNQPCVLHSFVLSVSLSTDLSSPSWGPQSQTKVGGDHNCWHWHFAIIEHQHKHPKMIWIRSLCCNLDFRKFSTGSPRLVRRFTILLCQSLLLDSPSCWYIGA